MIRIAAIVDEMYVLERFERMVSEIKELELCSLSESGEQLLTYLKEHPLDALYAQDASFALDELTELNKSDPNHILTGRLYLDHVGVFGISLGGMMRLEGWSEEDITQTLTNMRTVYENLPNEGYYVEIPKKNSIVVKIKIEYIIKKANWNYYSNWPFHTRM